jgi:hypothetical protein
LKIEPSAVPDVDLIGPGTADFRAALELLLGREPDETLRQALPFSVIVRNKTGRAIALLGVRFDMIGARARPYSVVHYSDTLRNPEKAGLKPGAMRFVCAEPLYTELVLRGKVNPLEADKRGRMNLENLARAREIRASLDCAAFDDGQFAGPDSLGAFDRLRLEREAEIEFVNEVLNAADLSTLLRSAMEIPARRVLAKLLQEGLQTGGRTETIALARSHRPRITLSR